MKNKIAAISFSIIVAFLAILGLGMLVSSTAHACSKQVTTLTTSTVSTIVIPGRFATVCAIQNTGANNIRLVIDGGASNGGTNPTTTSAYQLQSKKEVIFNVAINKKPIVAIMETGTTSLEIITDDGAGSDASTTFPTN